MPTNGKITEKELQATITHAAKTFGWLVYHTWNSMNSARGFPDLVMVKGQRLIFAELKRDGGELTADQQSWADALVKANVEHYVWRPSDLDKIYETLMRRI